MAAVCIHTHKKPIRFICLQKTLGVAYLPPATKSQVALSSSRRKHKLRRKGQFVNPWKSPSTIVKVPAARTILPARRDGSRVIPYTASTEHNYEGEKHISEMLDVRYEMLDSQNLRPYYVSKTKNPKRPYFRDRNPIYRRRHISRSVYREAYIPLKYRAAHII